MNIGEINEQIRIEDFLAKEGFLPEISKKAGAELWYNSPLRRESTPSFKVNAEKNVWYDYGLGVGGKLIELYRQLKNNDNINEIVYYFNNEYKGGASISSNYKKERKENSSIENIENGEILEEIVPIQNRKLWDYLRERKIDFDIAKEYLTEVHYKSNGKNWYALGFKCDNAGYELRNPFSKRNINGKNISTIKNGSDKVKIFEGYFDFLSYVSEHKDSYKNYDYIVINTSAFIEGMYNSIHREQHNYLYENLMKYSRIDTYFDNDNTGKKITGLMEELFSGINNFSVLFEKYEDYNEFCIEGRINGDFNPDESIIKVQNTFIKGNDKDKNISDNLGKWSHFKVN